jgi:hypothetical protein
VVDAVVRVVSFLSFRWLAKDFGARDVSAMLLAVAISVSVSFSVYGFGLVGLGVAMWAFRLLGQSRVANIFASLALLFVAANSSLAIHGAFVALSIPCALLVAYGSSNWRGISYITGLYLTGLLIGNLGILYSLVISGIHWHRESFLETWGLNQTLESIFSSSGVLYPLIDSFYYHAFMPVTILAAGVIVSNSFGAASGKSWKSKTTLLIVSAYVSFALTPVVKFAAGIISLRTSTVNLERLTIIGVAAVLLALLLESSTRNATSRRILTWAMVIQIIFACLFTPHLRAVLLSVAPSMPLAHIGMSFKALDDAPFREAKYLVGNEMALAIGIPSFRLNLAGIDTMGGYSSLYPQSHKEIFGAVISGALVDEDARDYFWNWGSRAELDQIDESQYCSVDFDSASKAGVSFVVSKSPLDCANGHPLFESNVLVVYSIDSLT